MSTLKVSAIQNAAAGSGGLVLAADGNVSGAGMDLIVSQSFSAVSAVNVDDCFSADYDNYRIMLSLAPSAASDVRLRGRASGVDISSANYFESLSAYHSSVGAYNQYAASVTFGRITIGANAFPRCSASLDFHNPVSTTLAHQVIGNVQYQLDSNGGFVAGSLSISELAGTALDGFSLLTSTGNITGTVRVYGYRN